MHKSSLTAEALGRMCGTPEYGVAPQQAVDLWSIACW
jgi:hypothetical protein